ncbi:unnamed protein product [Aspergillus oryzae RIB40]|uniref:DNA, SC166 n=1 Tax=Aspergillus oryzae (strain ATCC 42149 / RIB 40) TaxID=510516 RepID=Q2U9S9_ASPOR|nr:unnamed protein product [Aspergillus oryzae RIB40]BAE61686.1 unnamed protein product [Aspergillus oryzae RIB40]
MSQITSNRPHLFEDDLPESANTERKIFAEWASSVPFEKKADDFQIHNSKELDTKIVPFLRGIHWYRYRGRNMRHSTTAKAMRLSFQSRYLAIAPAPRESPSKKESDYI